jgi:predicted O-methyltransferase YrrM
MLGNKAKLILWYAKHPRYWHHAITYKVGKTLSRKDSAAFASQASKWARERAVPVEAALHQIGLLQQPSEDLPRLADGELAEASDRASVVPVTMGGAGDLTLIFASVVLKRATRVIETGVAYGWSSLAILAALERVGAGKLVSVDMPYPNVGNDEWVGAVVPPRLRDGWRLIRRPDRTGLRMAVREFDGRIDLAHYDSDKSYAGRRFGYEILWEALEPGGVFISDDIQDNFAFRDFVTERRATFAVTSAGKKFAGIAIKT